MGSYNASVDLQEMYSTKSLVIDDPGNGGTFSLQGKWGGVATVGTGNYTLPAGMPVGTVLYVVSTGNTAFAHGGEGVGAVLYLSANQVGMFFAIPDGIWVGTALGVGGTPAFAVTFDKTGTDFVTTNVQSVLQETDAIISA